MTTAGALGALIMTGAAALVVLPLRGARRRVREVTTGATGHRSGERRGETARPGASAAVSAVRLLLQRSPVLFVVAAGSMAVAVGAVAAGPVAALAGAGYGGAGAAALVRRSRARAEAAVRQAGLDAVAGLADDLRAGRLPGQALIAAMAGISRVVDGPTRAALRAVSGAARAGGDVAEALREVRDPGLTGAFHRLAAVWTLGDAGVPFAELIDRLEAELRAHRRSVERAAAQLAAARATGQLLGGLPLLGLVLGYALGVDPLGIVLHTVPGGVCAVLAMALQLGGSAWTRSLSSAAVRS